MFGFSLSKTRLVLWLSRPFLGWFWNSPKPFLGGSGENPFLCGLLWGSPNHFGAFSRPAVGLADFGALQTVSKAGSRAGFILLGSFGTALGFPRPFLGVLGLAIWG